MKVHEWNVVRPFALLVIASIIMSGCEISRSPKPGSSTVSQDINASHDAVWAAIPPVLRELGLRLHAVNAEDGYYLAAKPSTAFSYQDYIEVFVLHTSNDAVTHVEVASRSASPPQPDDLPWETEVLRRLSRRLLQPGQVDEVHRPPNAP